MSIFDTETPVLRSSTQRQPGPRFASARIASFATPSFALLCMLASCVADPRDLRDALVVDRGDASLELELRLPPQEAACLVAEALAYAHPNTQRDKLRPVTRVHKLPAADDGSERWQIAYVRAAGASFLPLANGYFTRACAGQRIAHSTPHRRPFELLPDLRFIPSEPCGVRGTRDFLSVEVHENGDGACSVRASAVGAPWAQHHLSEIAELLRTAAAIRRALDICARGDLEAGARSLTRALETQRKGFSYVHDPLLSHAHATLGQVEFELGRVHEARIAFARSRLLVPSNGRVLTLEARVHERMAQLDTSADKLRRARIATRGDGLFGRHVRSLEQAHRDLASRARDAEGMHSIAQSLLSSGDAIGALAWSERALDAKPGSSEALLHKARSLVAMGRHRSAKQALRMAQIDANPETAHGVAIRALLLTDERGVQPALALRRILRSSRKRPEILAEAATQRLAARLGAERCLRICKSEGVDVRILLRAMQWMQDEVEDPRARFLRNVLLSGIRERSAGQPMLGIEKRERDPDRVGAASGLARPKRAPAVAAPGR